MISRVVNLSVAAIGGIGGNPSSARPPSDRMALLIAVGTSLLCREADEVPGVTGGMDAVASPADSRS